MTLFKRDRSIRGGIPKDKRLSARSSLSGAIQELEDSIFGKQELTCKGVGAFLYKIARIFDVGDGGLPGPIGQTVTIFMVIGETAPGCSVLSVYEDCQTDIAVAHEQACHVIWHGDSRSPDPLRGNDFGYVAYRRRTQVKPLSLQGSHLAPLFDGFPKAFRSLEPVFLEHG